MMLSPPRRFTTTCLFLALCVSVVTADALITNLLPSSTKNPSFSLGRPSRYPSHLSNTSPPDDEKDETAIPRGGDAGGFRQSPPVLPTLTQYRKFALPCLGLWVAQPLLSLVDTAFVGLSSGSNSAAQLAALGPATTFIDGSTYLFAFLNVATTNLFSSALAKQGGKTLADGSESVVRTASRVAVRCGVGLAIFLWAFCRPLLALYIGKKMHWDGRMFVLFETTGREV